MSSGLLLAAASTSPSWYWFATRGLGVASLIILTATVVLGIGTSGRWRGDVTPGFVLANLHRNLSLLAVLIVVAHVVTTVLDPFAKIGVRDVIIPVGAAYRPIWLGLGVVAFEILILVAATSLLRNRLGPGTWRFIHWTAYASWPLAVFHGLGTGSDAQAPWLIGVTAACVAALGLAIGRRLLIGRVATLPIRFAGAILTVAVLYFGTSWALAGPLHPGWAARAGTPTVASTNPGPVHAGPNGFSDPLVGVMVRDPAGNTQISLRDTVDAALTIFIRSPTSSETLPVITVDRNGHELCSVPAQAATNLYTVCRGTRMTISLYGSESTPVGTSNVTGQLATSGPLNG